MDPRQTLLPLEPPPDPGAPAAAAPPPRASSASPAPAQREAFLRERLLAKARASRGEALGHRLSSTATARGPWETVAPGVRCLPLHESPDSRSVLLELAPGARLASPAPPAAARLECLLLHGDLQLGPSLLGAGDHLQAPAARDAGDWSTREGARFFLLTHLPQRPS